MTITNTPSDKDPNMVNNLVVIANVAEAACRTICGIESDLISDTLDNQEVTVKAVQDAVLTRMAARIPGLKMSA